MRIAPKFGMKKLAETMNRVSFSLKKHPQFLYYYLMIYKIIDYLCRNNLDWRIMKKSIFALAILALCAFAGCKQIDRTRVVTNPIDLDYEFTKGDGQGASATTDVDFNDPNLINSIPDEYKCVVLKILEY